MFAGQLTKSKAEKICKYYFYGGFLGLPFLWILVVFTFFPYRNVSDSIRFHVSVAAMLAVASLLVFGAWLGVVYGGLRGVEGIWVIQPDATTKQNGMFASDVYSVNF